jgi:hypothetical protein
VARRTRRRGGRGHGACPSPVIARLIHIGTMHTAHSTQHTYTYTHGGVGGGRRWRALAVGSRGRGGGRSRTALVCCLCVRCSTAALPFFPPPPCSPSARSPGHSRPVRFCWCAYVPSPPIRPRHTRVLILQHPLEVCGGEAGGGEGGGGGGGKPPHPYIHPCKHTHTHTHTHRHTDTHTAVHSFTCAVLTREGTGACRRGGRCGRCRCWSGVWRRTH